MTDPVFRPYLVTAGAFALLVGLMLLIAVNPWLALLVALTIAGLLAAAMRETGRFAAWVVGDDPDPDS